jgi:hypothetical protein
MSVKNRSRISFFFLLLCAVAPLIFVPGAAAQEARSVELIGVIEALSLNTVTVNQQTVNISRAEINTALTLGTLVEIEGTFGLDGAISAREVNAARPGMLPGEAELTGLLTGVSDSAFVVSGQLIDTTGAEIRGLPATGVRVRIHASVTGPNMWRAREVEVFGDDDTTRTANSEAFEITGTLEQIDGTTVIVAGQAISISGAEINDPLIIGTRVKAHVSMAAGGILTAREIELADPDDEGDNSNANSNDNSNDNANSNSNFNTNSNDNTRFAGAVTLEQAIREVRRVYPTAQIRRIELRTRFEDTLVWEIEISGGIRLLVDAQSGTLLSIVRPGSDDNTNSNSNDNDNRNDNEDDRGDNSNSNANSNRNDNDENGNDNEDDRRGNDNEDDDDHEDDDNDND